jgi:hypothetical protein
MALKWPLVWREDYDEACATIRHLERTIIEERARFVESQRMANELLALLKPPPQITPRNLEPLAVPQKDEVAEAIELAAGYDKSLARHLTRWAKQQQIDGMKEHDIIQSIIHWRNANEWDGDDSDVPQTFL